MTNGIACFSQSNTINLYTPTMESLFYFGGRVFYDSGNVQGNQFSKTTAITTSTEPVHMQRDNVVLSMSIGGDVATGGKSYFAPQKQQTGDITYEGFAIPHNLIQQPSYVHYFGVPQPYSGFGFLATNNNGNVAVDQNYKSLFIQPTTNGEFLRRSSASSLGGPEQYAYDVNVSYTQPTTQNIIFDKEYNNPPLIFITSSTGFISMNYMIKNQQGNYIGASIVAERSWGNFNSSYGPYVINSYDFEYFLVSEEKPDYIESIQYGMRVFDGGGNEVFDSSFFVPDFFNVAHPPIYASVKDQNIKNVSTYVNFSGPIGFCINNYHSITGAGWFSDYMLYDQIKAGPLYTTGKFLKVDKSAGVAYSQGGWSFGAFQYVRLGYDAGQVLLKAFGYEYKNSLSLGFDVLAATYDR